MASEWKSKQERMVAKVALETDKALSVTRKQEKLIQHVGGMQHSIITLKATIKDLRGVCFLKFKCFF